MDQFISVDEARAQILGAIGVTSAERVALSDALGRVLATAILAPRDSPRFDNSAMDGYAVRWEDLEALPATLDVVETISAGRVAEAVLEPGQAMRIMTGACVPAGADTVVQQELCEFDSVKGRVVVVDRPEAGKGAHIRRAGSYMKAGREAIAAGQVVTAAEIGMLASFGRAVVDVHREPVVAIVSTGDELVDLGEAVGPGQIVNSNAHMLAALVKAAGGRALVLPIAKDDLDETRQAFVEAARAADIVVSSGGVSVGDYDFVKVVLDELTGGMNFWKVRLKPGKPLAFGVSKEDGTPFIGLPGNPASSFVGFHLFVAPAIALARGVSVEDVSSVRLKAPLGADGGAARGRVSYVSGRLEEGRFTPMADQSSGNPTLFVGANALGVLEADAGVVPEGTVIDVIMLR